MLIKKSCNKCEVEIGNMQFANYYVCENCGNSICVDCYSKGQKTCNKCKGHFKYHDGDKNAKFAIDNNITF